MREKILIIAEAGVNHNGDLQLAKKLALEAKNAGADMVKYQTFKTENLVSKYAEKAAYQRAGLEDKESQFEMISKLELSYDDFRELQKYCTEIGILFLSTPFDTESIDFLDSIGMPIFKIPSGEVTNIPYLLRIASKKKPVIMSTGMCDEEEIELACKTLSAGGCDEIILLHCNTQYPTPYEDVNLLAMVGMRKRFGVKTGYSDHTLGIEISIAAAALGAAVIEKHFTLDRNLEGPDHRASLEPNDLSLMIRSIRNIAAALGDYKKRPTESEKANKDIVRKSIVAKYRINAGEIFTEENLTVKRPGTGISPIKWFDVIGRQAKKDFNKDDMIEV